MRVRLTPVAYANGLALALPEEVVVPAPFRHGKRLGADQIWHWRARQVSATPLVSLTTRSVAWDRKAT